MIKKTLGSRMKGYEESTDFRIIPRTPIIIRIDGKGFSGLTKRLKCEKPYDKIFSGWMQKTSERVAKEVQGCVLAYSQSDEITFVIRTDQSMETVPWFDNRIQKIISVIASVASACFNGEMSKWWREKGGNDEDSPMAFFDCRAFPVPSMVEVANCLVWRQRDCIRNSISGSCQAEFGKKFGRKEAKRILQHKNQNQQQELLREKIGISWDDYCDEFRSGTVTFRSQEMVSTPNGEVMRSKWKTISAPEFTSDDGRKWLSDILSSGKSKKE